MIRAAWRYFRTRARLVAHQRRHGALPCQLYSDCHQPAGHSGPHSHGRPCAELNPVTRHRCLRRAPDHLVHRDGHGMEWHLYTEAELDTETQQLRWGGRTRDQHL